ncbi:MAG: serine O-acetyltransferase, partial [Spirochaetaceae bacterium]
MNNEYKDESLDFIEETARHLSTEEVLSTIYHNGATDVPMPSTSVLADITEKLRTVLFPGYFGDPKMKDSYLHYHIGSLLDEIYRSIGEQIRRGYCFQCEIDTPSQVQCKKCAANSKESAKRLIVRLTAIRHLLSTDAQAAFEGDPAGSSVGETIFCYPSLRALTNYRIAHELYTLNVPLIPRIITEIAHSETGIDIHPGAEIGERFFIDHGTGVVIGETSVI